MLEDADTPGNMGRMSLTTTLTPSIINRLAGGINRFVNENGVSTYIHRAAGIVQAIGLQNIDSPFFPVIKFSGTNYQGGTIDTMGYGYVYNDIAKGFLGDWQSPVMTVLWALIDPIAPGSGSLFLLIVTLYWLAFGLLAFTIARHSVWRAVVLLLLAASPPAFVFVGIIWRDVLFADTWLLAAALSFATADRSIKLRLPAQAMALGLLALGVLIRPNALAAAPILAAYILWPARFGLKRTAILYVPAALGLFGLVQVIYYNVLGATRQQPLHSIMVFDLGGISHFAKTNVFPGSWTADETALHHSWLLSADRVGHLLEAGAVSVRDEISRTRKAVHFPCAHGCLEARDRQPPRRLSAAPRRVHVEFPRWREPHNVDLRPRRSVKAAAEGPFRLYRGQNGARCTQADTAVPGGIVAARLRRGLCVCVARPQHPVGSVCHGSLWIGRCLCADLFRRRGRLGLPLLLLGGARGHRRCPRARAAPFAAS